ncbi:hypothetical protein HKX48_006469 [Thoreauomyces humboldtii]|nr:hypothetical protein HKX48_006469 [Thoreauomyces humboldtii]
MPEVPPPWRKLLYVKQDYPDNFVDDSFLELLQENVNIRVHFFWETVLRTCAVSQQLSSIVIFVAIFSLLYTGALAPETLLFVDATGVAVGYGIWDALRIPPPETGRQRWVIIRRALLILATMFGLTPVLQSLTIAISSDTIWAMTVILFIANLVFHDYGSEDTVKVRFPDSLSINAGIFASVLLASRLPSRAHVLGLMLFAVLTFVLLPAFRRTCRSAVPMTDPVMLSILVGLAASLFSRIAQSLVIIYLISITFVTFVCPYWLVHAQKYKSRIRGPWDEAQIRRASTSTG